MVPQAPWARPQAVRSANAGHGSRVDEPCSWLLSTTREVARTRVAESPVLGLPAFCRAARR